MEPAAPIVPVEMLQESFRLIQTEMRASALVRQIRDFSGEGERRFAEWLGDIRRIGHALNANRNQFITLAMQTLKGTAADFLARIIRENPNITWDQIVESLTTQYLSDNEAQIAKQKLKRLMQKKGESVQNFGERILFLADRAYNDINDPVIQSSLIDILIDGVENDNLAKHLLKTPPANFHEALEHATRDQNVNKAFNLRRRLEEPMDISTLANKNDRVQQLENAVLNLSSQVEKLVASHSEKSNPQNNSRKYNHQQTTSRPYNQANPRPYRPQQSAFRHRWTQDGRPICSKCTKTGHISKYCKQHPNA